MLSVHLYQDLKFRGGEKKLAELFWCLTCSVLALKHSNSIKSAMVEHKLRIQEDGIGGLTKKLSK